MIDMRGFVPMMTVQQGRVDRLLAAKASLQTKVDAARAELSQAQASAQVGVRADA